VVAILADLYHCTRENKNICNIENYPKSRRIIIQ